MKKVLIVDDHRSTADAIAQIVEGKDLQPLTAGSMEAGWDIFQHEGADLVITDLKLPGKSGMVLLERVREADANVPVIVVTAFGTVETAVSAMKMGALDYITKPISMEELEIKIEKGLSSRQLTLKNQQLELENRYLRELERQTFTEIIGQSAPMQKVFDVLAKVAPTNSTILVLGESGTGKELIARAIHMNSPRKDLPFIKLNCAALAEGVLESELFGHEKGAFTGAHKRKPGRFEIAGEGTIFLDEISEISQAIQVKLLRVLQEREFERVGGNLTLPMNARIVAASNQDLSQLIGLNRFREDLYYRLNVVSVDLPPLRKRLNDIPLLTQHFLDKYGSAMGKTDLTLDPEARQILQDYHWPGNIRELENAVERAVVLCDESTIYPDDLPVGMENRPAGGAGSSAGGGTGLSGHVMDMEIRLIREAMSDAGGNISRASRQLGMKRTTLRYKLEKYGLLDGE